MNPQRDYQRRTENILNIWILEAKGVAPKGRYFCELYLGKTLNGRTSAKPREDSCFWGEFYETTDFKKINDICIKLYRETDSKKKKKISDPPKLIGYIQIKIEQLIARHPVEKWYTVSSGTENLSLLKSNSKNGTDLTAIRVKARYQTIEIMPLQVYDKLLNFAQYNYLPLCLILEPVLGVKAKEDLATSLVRVLQQQRLAIDFLCNLVMAEVDALDNDHLMFRGNSLATKAMEAYMKLVAGDYLLETLGDYVKQVLDSNESCEVDPLKLGSNNGSTLERNQQNLIRQANTAWSRIFNSALRFPYQLRHVFNALRMRLQKSNRVGLTDNLISSSIFLRFLCPAILSPSLFNLVSEYPTGPAARNLTLIAKTLQTLANFTKFGGKESYMEFMNNFVCQKFKQMQEFLVKISVSSTEFSVKERQLASDEDIDREIDLGKELSLLHFYLQESWNPQLHVKTKKEEVNLSELWSIIVEISSTHAQYFNENSENLNIINNGAYNYPNNPPSDYENNVLNSSSTSNSTSAKTSRSSHLNCLINNNNNKQIHPTLSHYTSANFNIKNSRAPTHSSLPIATNLQNNADYVLPAALNNDLFLSLRTHQQLPSKHQQRHSAVSMAAISNHNSQMSNSTMSLHGSEEPLNETAERTYSSVVSTPQISQKNLENYATDASKSETNVLTSQRNIWRIYDDTPTSDFDAAHFYDEVPNVVPKQFSDQQMATRHLLQNMSQRNEIFPLKSGSIAQILSLQQQQAQNPHGSLSQVSAILSDSDEELPNMNLRHPPYRKPKKRILGNSFGASSDSTTSAGIHSNFTGAEPSTSSRVGGALIALPSSGYQSQNHSNSSSSSSSPIDNCEVCTGTSTTTLRADLTRLPLVRSAIAVSNPLCDQNASTFEVLASSPPLINIHANDMYSNPSSTISSSISNSYSNATVSSSGYSSLTHTSNNFYGSPKDYNNSLLKNGYLATTNNSNTDSTQILQTNPCTPNISQNSTNIASKPSLKISPTRQTPMITLLPKSFLIRNPLATKENDACFSSRPRAATAPLIVPMVQSKLANSNGDLPNLKKIPLNSQKDSEFETSKNEPLIVQQRRQIEKLLRENDALKKALAVSKSMETPKTSFTESVDSFESFNSALLNNDNTINLNPISPLSQAKSLSPQANSTMSPHLLMAEEILTASLENVFNSQK